MDLTPSSARVALPTSPVRRTTRLTRAQRAARGRAVRPRAPRRTHAAWAASPGRPDPVDVLEQQAATRVPELVPIRYGRMLLSPFTFYRGAAAVMAADLAGTPQTGLVVQCCGDAHLSNFGLFASPERQLLFDINDFDETLPGPWEWDVKRLAASFEVAGRDRGFSPADRRDIVRATVRAYRKQLHRAADQGALDVWYSHLNQHRLMAWVDAELEDDRIGKREARNLARDVAKARTRDRMRAVRKLTVADGGGLRFAADPPLVVPLEDLVLDEDERRRTERSLRKLLKRYRRTLADEHHPIEDYRYVHMARKVVGVGSVGTRAWIMLLLGVDEQDPLVLQAKEAQPSVLEPYAGRSVYPTHGQRVVVGQRLMQTATDIFLGWQQVKDLDGQRRDYYVRQLHDWKGSADVDVMRVPGAELYGRMCGATLARAHARSGDWVALAAYLGTGDRFDQAVADFAVAYADQTERDYEALVAAVRRGRVRAEVGL